MGDAPKNVTREPGVDAEGDSRTVKDHIALQNQSSVTPSDYPAAERAAQSLVNKDKKARPKT